MCVKQNRSIESFLYRPAAHQSRVQCTWEHPNFMRPISYAQGSSTVRDKSTAGRVACLFTVCCPDAILGRVIAVIVYAMNAVAATRVWPHVGKEVLEYVPSRADLDATAAVSVVADGVFVGTAISHSLPGAVFRRLVHAMPSIAATAAPSTNAAPKITSENKFFSSALATAHPDTASVFACGMESDDSPKPKDLARKVYESVSVLGRVLSSHQKNLLRRFGWWIGPARSCNLLVGPFHYNPRQAA